MSKIKIVVPVWLGHTNESYWGGNDHFRSADTCASTWISLRVKKDDPDAWTTDADRTYQDIGVYVWYSDDGCITLDIRPHNICDGELRELELLIKKTKALRAKVIKSYPLAHFVRDSDIHTELIKLFAAMDITESVIYDTSSYQRANDGYQPIGITVKRISDLLNERKAQMKRRAA